MLRVVARHATSGTPSPRARTWCGLGLLDRYCAEIGRDPSTIERSVHVGGDPWQNGPALRELGVSLFTVSTKARLRPRHHPPLDRRRRPSRRCKDCRPPGPVAGYLRAAVGWTVLARPGARLVWDRGGLEGQLQERRPSREGGVVVAEGRGGRVEAYEGVDRGGARRGPGGRGGLRHMPMWGVLLALIGGTAVFGYLGTRTFTKRVLN